MPGECIVCVELCGGPSELRKAVEIIVTIMEAFHASCDNGHARQSFSQWIRCLQCVTILDPFRRYICACRKPVMGSTGESLEMWDTERQTRIDQLQNNLS